MNGAMKIHQITIHQINDSLKNLFVKLTIHQKIGMWNHLFYQICNLRGMSFFTEFRVRLGKVSSKSRFLVNI